MLLCHSFNPSLFLKALGNLKGITRTVEEKNKKVGVTQTFLFLVERYDCKICDNNIEVAEKGGCCVLLILLRDRNYCRMFFCR